MPTPGNVEEEEEEEEEGKEEDDENEEEENDDLDGHSYTTWECSLNVKMSANDFYLRYYVGHKGKFGHEFLEFEFRPDGKLCLNSFLDLLRMLLAI